MIKKNNKENQETEKIKTTRVVPMKQIHGTASEYGRLQICIHTSS
jgi:hypothetical protein